MVVNFRQANNFSRLIGEEHSVIIPFLSGLFPGLHAASFSFMAGVIPPMPILGR